MINENNDQQIFAMRHSMAHIMATAIQELFPNAKFGIGPVVENGFYYDVEIEPRLTENDLPTIEAKMHEVIKSDYAFESSTMDIDEAMGYFADQPFKVELLKDLKVHGTTIAKDIDRTQLGLEADDKVSDVGIYTDGPFTDLCRGPHVASTGQVGKYFKLMRLSGAYWRGDEHNAQLQRIYGVGFATKNELHKYLELLTEAEKRDHRKLGRDMDLFVFSDLVGQGLPLFTPRGTTIREELNSFVQELRQTVGGGYQAVTIPHITKKDLYEKSGHWKKFSDELFKIETREGHLFAMKPMNCPHHAQIYASKPRSYRDLPIRYRETTMVYRDEQSGELSGLSRVRAITQDDAHVFLRVPDIHPEIARIWEIISRFYETMGIPLKVRFSRHDPTSMENYVGDPETWKMAETAIEGAIKDKLGNDYVDGLGEAAFYGPKIDFMGHDAFGREFQAATIQLDFGQPAGFNLVCTNEQGESEQIVMLHCAVMGSLERFMVLILEQTAGQFPTWLAPEQVRLAPVNDSEALMTFCDSIREQLVDAGVRVEVDTTVESVGKKIRTAGLAKVPYTLVIGEKERESGRVTPRLRTGHGVEVGEMAVEEFVSGVAHEIRTRAAKSSLSKR
jgi:threonyl-tRNA synthetase